MNEIDWKRVTIQITGLALQGLIERETSIASKVISDVLTDKMAEHAVKLASACVKHLKKEFEKDNE